MSVGARVYRYAVGCGHGRACAFYTGLYTSGICSSCGRRQRIYLQELLFELGLITGDFSFNNLRLTFEW